MSIQLFRKHSKAILDSINKGIQLPNSKHVQKRFNQSDLFRTFAVRCPVNSLDEEAHIQKMITFRASIGIKDKYICGQCPFQKDCPHAFNKEGEETKPDFDVNLMSFYLQKLSQLDDNTFNSILSAKQNQYNTNQDASDNHFIYWGSTLRILDTLERIVQDSLENDGELTKSFISQNETYNKTFDQSQSQGQRAQSSYNNQDSSEKKQRSDDFTRQFSRDSSNTTERKPYQSYEKKDYSSSYRSSDQGERKPYEKREYGDQSERKPYEKREYGDQSERKPYERREYGDSSERKPYQKREYGDQSERKPYQKREYGDQNERRPYQSGDQGERRPYQKREYGDSNSEGRPAYEKRPYTPRSSDGDQPRYNNRESSSYSNPRPQRRNEESGGEVARNTRSSAEQDGFREELKDYAKVSTNPRFQKEFVSKMQNDDSEGGENFTASKRITPDDMLMRKSDTQREGGRNIKDGKFKFTKTV